MASTNAERQRRYRERKRAEQAQTRATTAEAVTPPVTRNSVTPPVTVDLGPRGRQLWADVAGDGVDLRPAERVLLEEACRTTDRLDQLDRLLRGDDDAWVRLHSRNEDGTVVQVVLNNALAEARQQQMALRAVLAELRQSRAGAGGKPAGRAAAARSVAGEVKGAAGVADLTARIADRQRNTAG